MLAACLGEVGQGLPNVPCVLRSLIVQYALGVAIPWRSDIDRCGHALCVGADGSVFTNVGDRQLKGNHHLSRTSPDGKLHQVFHHQGMLVGTDETRTRLFCEVSYMCGSQVLVRHTSHHNEAKAYREIPRVYSFGLVDPVRDVAYAVAQCEREGAYDDYDDYCEGSICLAVLKPSGNMSDVANWGQHGSGDGEFHSIVAVAATHSRVYVLDHALCRVQVFHRDVLDRRREADGKTSSPFAFKWGERGSLPGQLNGPTSLAMDAASGRLYVADTGNCRVQAFSEDGQFLAEYYAEGEPVAFRAVAVGPDGKVFAAAVGGSTIYTLSAD